MSNNISESSETGVSRRNKPTAEQHAVASAIDALKEQYKSAEANHTKHEKKTLFWARVAGIGVGLYTILTIPIVVASIYSANTAGDTEKRQLRAYVGIMPSGVENFGDPAKQTFTLIRKNFGNTPAYKVFLDHREDVVSTGAPIVPVENNPHDTKDVWLTLFPSMEAPRYFLGTKISQQRLDLVQDGKEFQIVYYGIIYYADAFGTKHYTRYCWLFTGKRMTGKDAIGCLQHNDSD